jgi:hypothetical protein
MFSIITIGFGIITLVSFRSACECSDVDGAFSVLRSFKTTSK